MAGHNKWSQIKRKKAVTDAKRAKLYSRYLREIQIAAKTGGANPDGNPRLRTAIAAAKAMSVPNDNIERAIKRGAGDGESESIEEITYEGYGPGGAALMIKTITDNKNRTAADIRHILSKNGGNLGGSVAFLFSERGVISVPKSVTTEEKLLELALEAGALDVEEKDGFFEVSTEPKDLHSVSEALGFDGVEASIRYIPATTVSLSGEEAKAMIKLLDMLDDYDDVQEVISNFEIDESELEALAV
jgi:YebC/PmpR family DNA-binding regulatory protein